MDQVVGEWDHGNGRASITSRRRNHNHNHLPPSAIPTAKKTVYSCGMILPLCTGQKDVKTLEEIYKYRYATEFRFISVSCTDRVAPNP
jgi:hypothetical protein